MMKCRCVGNGTVDIIGLCDTSKIDFSECDEIVNSTEISIPEILTIPCEKPCIESIDKVFVDVKIISKRMVKTPAALSVGTTPAQITPVPNKEGTFLTGGKLVVEGILCQKIVYTADLPVQSVHSAHFKVPFSVFIMLPLGTDVDEDKFCVDVCVEDVFVKKISCKQIFKNVTVFFRAKPLPLCNGVVTDTPDIVPVPVATDTTVSGTAEPGSTIILCINGIPETPVIAAADGSWEFTGLTALVSGDVVRVTAKAPGELVSLPDEETVA